MAKQRTAEQAYVVSIHNEPEPSGGLRFTFVPSGRAQSRLPDGRIKTDPQYIVTVTGYGESTEFAWHRAPESERVKEQLEKIARDRVTLRHRWIERVQRLVDEVKAWAVELGWTSKVVAKKLEDPDIGTHRVSALVLQEEGMKLFMEPIARAAPGVQGVVDLYLMPEYDDVASLYFYDRRWNVHYAFDGKPAVANVQEVEAKPLTKETLRRVFDDMKRHAG